jgi:hypothetical protein
LFPPGAADTKSVPLIGIVFVARRRLLPATAIDADRASDVFSKL